MSQMIAVEGVDHIGIRVHDLDHALNFYRLWDSSLYIKPKATSSRSFAMKTESS